jgi:ATP-dependent Zn protease
MIDNEIKTIIETAYKNMQDIAPEYAEKKLSKTEEQALFKKILKAMTMKQCIREEIRYQAEIQ